MHEAPDLTRPVLLVASVLELPTKQHGQHGIVGLVERSFVSPNGLVAFDLGIGITKGGGQLVAGLCHDVKRCA